MSTILVWTDNKIFIRLHSFKWHYGGGAPELRDEEKMFCDSCSFGNKETGLRPDTHFGICVHHANSPADGWHEKSYTISGLLAVGVFHLSSTARNCTMTDIANFTTPTDSEVEEKWKLVDFGPRVSTYLPATRSAWCEAFAILVKPSTTIHMHKIPNRKKPKRRP